MFLLVVTKSRSEDSNTQPHPICLWKNGVALTWSAYFLKGQKNHFTAGMYPAGGPVRGYSSFIAARCRAEISGSHYTVRRSTGH